MLRSALSTPIYIGLVESERKCGAGCTHPRIRQLKEPQIILPTFTEAQVNCSSVGSRDQKTSTSGGSILLVLLLLDSGCRISEALTLRVSDVDLDDLLVTLRREGKKATNRPVLVRPAEGPPPLHCRLQTEK